MCVPTERQRQVSRQTLVDPDNAAAIRVRRAAQRGGVLNVTKRRDMKLSPSFESVPQRARCGLLQEICDNG